jgi:hypothetical protein
MVKNAVYHLISRILARRTSPSRAGRLQTVSRWAAAVTYSILALGIPLPTLSVKTSKEPFPCMNHRCGCQSAEQCWRNCCCMNLEQRLIWARENHVRPPDYVLAEARAKGIEWAVNWPSSQREDSSWCVASGTAVENSDCQKSSGEGSCCKPVASECHCCACEHYAKAKADERQADNGVLLMNALKCHGAGDNWQGMAISLPPQTAVQFHFSDEAVGNVSFYSLHFSSVSFSPDVPPPRFLIRG